MRRPWTGKHAYSESRGERRMLHEGDKLRADEIEVDGAIPGPPPPGPDPRDVKIAELEAAVAAVRADVEALKG